MRILIIHNKYSGSVGGEDSAVLKEIELLKFYNNEVETLYFHNDDLRNSVRLNPINLIFNFKSYQIVNKKIKEFRPEVVHVHNFFYLASPSIFYAAKKLKVKTVLTIHNFRLICPAGFLFRDGSICELCVNCSFPYHAIKNKCFKNSVLFSFLLSITLFIHNFFGSWEKIDKIICLTDFYKKKLLSSKLNVNERQIAIKQNFTPNNFPYIETPSNEGSLLFVGRLSKEKGIDILIDLVRTKLFNIEIIGEGPLKNQIIELEKTFPNLVYHGFRDSDFIQQRMRNAKFLIFTSKWYEGMPLVILEALSFGLPVICSDIDNLNEIVQNGISGILFKNGDLNDLVKKINSISNEELKGLKKESYKTYILKYSKEHNFKLLNKIYTKLILEK
jgi:glycosyltransferase involved in cell wall biosynthesis